MHTNAFPNAPRWRAAAARAGLLGWLERHHRLALAAMVALFVVALFGGLTYKLATWAQGYDQIDYQQSIWSTTQGRFLAITHYRHTDSLWGLDFIPAILLVVPLYALLPSALTLNAVQALCMGLGALPAYAAARDRFGSRPAGLAWAAIYLLYPSTWFVTMSAPWQPRTLAVPALLGAFCFLQRAALARQAGRPGSRAWRWFALCLLAALTTRTDASLCVIGFGLLAGAWRLGWRWAIPPVVVGAAWLLVSTSVVVPAFYRADYVPAEVTGGADSCEDYSRTWPGKSPQLAYYCHLGGSAGEIATTILTKPAKVAQIVLTPPKIAYVALMLLPLLFLPLLAPDAALPALPILAMNVLTNRPFQYTVREQYQALVVPGLIIAAMVGAARLWGWWRAARARRQEGGRRRGDTPPGRRPADRLAAPALLALVACALVANLVYRNPVLAAVRYRESPERIAAMRELAALVPPDAPLAATSFLAPNMMPRRQIYYFPSSPSFPPLERADYLFIDTRAAALDTPAGREQLQAVQGSGRWAVVAAREDLLLLRQVR